jgi:hypothetical protein
LEYGVYGVDWCIWLAFEIFHGPSLGRRGLGWAVMIMIPLFCVWLGWRVREDGKDGMCIGILGVAYSIVFIWRRPMNQNS